ncbi:hypothetical protein HDZ31DRAFT_66568 [Schizophyllum fasciatum]
MSSSSTYERLQQKATEWMKRFHAAGDKLEAQPWIDEFWAPNCVLQFSNAPEVRGRQDLITNFSSQFTHLEVMRHSILLDIIQNKMYLRASIIYRAKGDPHRVDVTIPAFAVFFFPAALTVDGNFGKMDRFEVYLNSAPIQERIAEAQKAAGEAGMRE